MPTLPPRAHLTGSLKSLCAAVVLIGMSLATLADDYEDGYEKYLQGDFQGALALWRPLVKTDVRAQFGLGTLYFDGDGVEQDYVESARWFSLAAEQGYAPAQFNLGNAFKAGNGVELDERRANHWWLLAADQEFSPAQFNLGTQYYFGRGVSRNEPAALRWYKRAADNGHPKAIEVLASLQGTAAEPAAADEQLAPTANSSTLAESAVPVSNGNDWIRAQPDTDFTLQLLASQNRDAVNQMLGNNGLAETAVVVSFKKASQQWFAVVLGSYPDRQSATDAVAALPSALQSLKPWIRPFSSLKPILD